MNKRQAKQRAQARAERSKSYASKYFSTGAEVQSAVNRINSRIRTAWQHFGEDSKIVQDMYTKLDMLIPQKNIRHNADGVLQISKPYELFKNSDAHEVIFNFDTSDIKKYSDIKAEYRDAYDRYIETQNFYSPNSDDMDYVGIEDYINIWTGLLDALAWAYNNQDIEEGQNIISIMREKGGCTYNDLMYVMKNYNRGLDNERTI